MHKTTRVPGWVVLFAALWLSSFSGCFGCLDILPPDGTGGGAGGGSGGGFTINGRLMSGQQPGPNARVEVKKGGVVLGTTTASSGFFSLSVDPGGRSLLLVTIKADGINPIQRTVQADRTGEITLEEQVVALQALSCTGTTCTTGGLRVEGLPAGTTGSGRAFNPVTEINAFPGGFNDSDGNLLLSGAFATVELKDAAGNPLTQMASPASLRMPFPKDTWPLLVDLTAGDGKVTVPLFYFDEALATWKREGQGDVVLESGTTIAEADIAAVRAGTYANPLFVTGQVRHFSTWNVDWPIASHGCVMGRIVADTRVAKAGAKVEIEGVTYTGRSPAIVTGVDGRFCADVLRSEAAGEDVDNNGTPGQVQRVAVYVSADDKVFDGRTHAIPTTAATCGGACLDLGDVVLDATSEFIPQLCSVSGTLVDASGAPVSGVTVSGFSTATTEQVTALCPDFSCYSLSKTTGVDGSFAGSVAVRDRLTLMAVRTDNPEPNTQRVEQAYQEIRGCPRTPVRLQMGPTTLYTDLDVTVSGQNISWSPAVTLSMVVVLTASDATRWAIFTNPPSLTSPLLYGSTPPNSTALPGSIGGALSSGDTVSVQGNVQQGTTARVYSGTFTVP